MGSTFAPEYANLYVGFFEHSYVFDINKNNFLHKILKRLRYLDDVFCIFQGTSNELTEFVNLLNGMNPDLKFSVNFDQKRVSFLDM